MPCLLTLSFFRVQFLSDFVLYCRVQQCIVLLTTCALLARSDPLPSLEYLKNYLQDLTLNPILSLFMLFPS